MKDGIFKREAKFMVGMCVMIPVVGIVAAIVVPYLAKTVCCNNTIAAEYTSPDSTQKAVVFSRDCGATTDFNTQISIIPFKEKLPNDGGNVFIADSDHGKATTGQWGGPNVAVIWQDKNTVKVSYADNSRVFKKQVLVSGVSIIYSEGIAAANQKNAPDQKAVR